MAYYSASFENMQTHVIQQWLHVAQHQLDHHKEGVVREMLLDGIRSAATELLSRYREQVRA